MESEAYDLEYFNVTETYYQQLVTPGPYMVNRLKSKPFHAERLDSSCCRA